MNNMNKWLIVVWIIAFALPALASHVAFDYQVSPYETIHSALWNTTMAQILVALNYITGDRLADNSIPASKLATGSITTDKILDNTIPPWKLTDTVLSSAGGLEWATSLIELRGGAQIKTLPATNGLELSGGYLRLAALAAGDGIQGGGGSPLALDLYANGGLDYYSTGLTQGSYQLKIKDDGVTKYMVNANVAGLGLGKATDDSLYVSINPAKFTVANDYLDIQPYSIGLGDVNLDVTSGQNLDLKTVMARTSDGCLANHCLGMRLATKLVTVTGTSPTLSAWQSVATGWTETDFGANTNPAWYYVQIGAVATMGTSGWLAVQFAPYDDAAYEPDNYYYQTMGNIDADNGIKACNGTFMVSMTSTNHNIRYRYIAAHAATLKIYAIARYNHKPYQD